MKKIFFVALLNEKNEGKDNTRQARQMMMMEMMKKNLNDEHKRNEMKIHFEEFSFLSY